MKKERTLVVIKPDGVQRSLIGEIINRYERTGLKLVAIKMFVPDAKFIENHYLITPDWLEMVGQRSMEGYEKRGVKTSFKTPKEVGEFVLDALKKFMTSGPVVAMVWEGMNAAGVVKKIAGSTEPLGSDVGTIRGDYTIDSYNMGDSDRRAIRNIVHVSDSREEAEKEIPHWFTDKEIVGYRLIQESILYDVDLNGILE